MVSAARRNRSEEILSFSSSLLYITAFLGGLFFISALILGIQTIYNKVVGISASGFTTVILLQLIIGSLVMFCLAIIGIYIGNGNMVHASGKGSGTVGQYPDQCVKVTSVAPGSYFYRHIYNCRRLY